MEDVGEEDSSSHYFGEGWCINIVWMLVWESSISILKFWIYCSCAGDTFPQYSNVTRDH